MIFVARFARRWAGKADVAFVVPLQAAGRVEQIYAMTFAVHAAARMRQEDFCNACCARCLPALDLHLLPGGITRRMLCALLSLHAFGRAQQVGCMLISCYMSFAEVGRGCMHK